MGMAINTNIDALDALRNLNITAGNFSSSVQKLSSGLRINTAADDAAGYAISNKLQAQVTGLNQAQRNAQDGVSMVQTAAGALNEIQSMLQRVRELGVEAANATVGSSDAASISTEVTALHDEINRLATATTFNGTALLTGGVAVSQTGGTATVGMQLTDAKAAVSAINVSGAAAGTFTLSSSAGHLTLTNGSGVAQTVAVADMTTGGTQTFNFSQLGVSITVAGAADAADTAANLEKDLAAPGSTSGTAAIGGTSGADLENNDTLTQPVTTPVVAGGEVTYWNGLDESGGSTPLTATASAGVAAGTLTLSTFSDAVTGTLNGETFTGTLTANPGASSSVTLTGDAGHTVVLDFKQAASADLFSLAEDVDGAAFTFGGSAAVSGLSVDPSATAGPYTFSSTAAGSLTLTGPDGPQTATVSDMAGGATQTLTFGNVSFTLTAGATGIAASSVIASLLDPAENTIDVTSSGGGGGGSATITTTATGTGASVFQVGANAGETIGVTFANAGTSAYTGFDAAVAAFNTDAVTTPANWATNQQTDTTNLLTATDNAITTVNTIASSLGAVQNRLSHTIAAVGVASENLDASESRIKDLDVASEMVNFTKTQILQQAGTAILAQANSAPQSILTLLR